MLFLSASDNLFSVLLPTLSCYYLFITFPLIFYSVSSADNSNIEVIEIPLKQFVCTIEDLPFFPYSVTCPCTFSMNTEKKNNHVKVKKTH